MLFREVLTLEQEYEQQRRRIEDMIKRENKLKQKNTLIASSLSVLLTQSFDLEMQLC